MHNHRSAAQWRRYDAAQRTRKVNSGGVGGSPAALVTAGAGDCQLRLNQPGQASTLLDDGIGLFDESFSRDRQIYLIHLAEALTQPGKQRDFEAAVDPRAGSAAPGGESDFGPRRRVPP